MTASSAACGTYASETVSGHFDVLALNLGLYRARKRACARVVIFPAAGSGVAPIRSSPPPLPAIPLPPKPVLQIPLARKFAQVDSVSSDMPAPRAELFICTQPELHWCRCTGAAFTGRSLYKKEARCQSRRLDSNQHASRAPNQRHIYFSHSVGAGLVPALSRIIFLF